jgi:hypothetical protein
MTFLLAKSTATAKTIGASFLDARAANLDAHRIGTN